jgi:solute carrier family 15 (oligopeptide transporter), member 1
MTLSFFIILLYLAILALFINQKLHFDSNSTTALFHVNELVLYFFTVVFAVVADSWLGLYKTILYNTVLSAFGVGIIALLTIQTEPIVILAIIGLTLHVLASGGIKSNLNVFGGNQFILPEEEGRLKSYFAKQYFVMECGLLLGQVLLPILKNEVKCFGADDCFPLAFGVAAALLLINFIVFACGRSRYIHVKPTGNAHENGLLKVCCCCLVRIKQVYCEASVAYMSHLFPDCSQTEAFWTTHFPL